MDGFIDGLQGVHEGRMESFIVNTDGIIDSYREYLRDGWNQ